MALMVEKKKQESVQCWKSPKKTGNLEISDPILLYAYEQYLVSAANKQNSTSCI